MLRNAVAADRALDDRREVEDRDGQHTANIPSDRGRVDPSPHAETVVVTIHPSSILRGDPEQRETGARNRERRSRSSRLARKHRSSGIP